MAVEEASSLPLLLPATTNKAEEAGRGIIAKLVEMKDEARKQTYIAGPMMVVSLSLYFLQVVSVMMVGHHGELSLSSTAIAVSLGAVTGFSPVYGMASALETTCGQAYGGGQYRKFGLQIYTAILCLFLICIPLSVLWLFMGQLLVRTGQDPDISDKAGKFLVGLIPALFAYATLQPIIRYFQMQSLVIPMLLSSCATIVCHVVLCWAVVFKSGLGNIGAAFALGFSYWFDVVLLVLYMKYSPSCAKTRVPISMEVFGGIGEFFRFAVPSAIMIWLASLLSFTKFCFDPQSLFHFWIFSLEWWSFELLTLLSGFLPNPKLEASVLSVCLSTITALYTIPDSLSAAVSTRVSNELGAGNAYRAHLAVTTVMVMATLEVAVMSSLLFTARHSFGYVFSNEQEVVAYVANIAPLVCLAVILDAAHAVLSGVSRGCGWQDIGAYINLAAYYGCGIPVSVVLGFWRNLGGTGLWIGILVGSFVQSLLLLIVTICANWEKRAKNTRERMFQGMTDVE